ncbi:hypothetical protein [Bordetella flabilis]|uniref:hypothetical protein n=1 Tax=Bordetella flabilis TaxID=463014 RepID=UPI0012F4FCC2|nr:hypothetical protein [Bordetella flabilis]
MHTCTGYAAFHRGLGALWRTSWRDQNSLRQSSASSSRVFTSIITPSGVRQKKREPRELLKTSVSIWTPSVLNACYSASTFRSVGSSKRKWKRPGHATASLVLSSTMSQPSRFRGGLFFSGSDGHRSGFMAANISS